MSYFSRLTDIVTCNLSELLAREADPATAITRIIDEMEEGVAGAQRSVAAANASAERLQSEIQEHRAQIDALHAKARDALTAGDEAAARAALVRRTEIEDVVAGLELQHKAALSTREHLSTTLRALEARVAEARRKMQRLDAGLPLHEPPPVEAVRDAEALGPPPVDATRARQVEAELEALKRSLERG